MDKRATIKDIANKAGVSISSVHLALSGKDGVSESTRQRIQSVASELDYRPNILASSLKREKRHVAVIMPPRDENSRYFYDYMWDAIEDYESDARDFNLEFHTFICSDGKVDLGGYDISDFSGIILIAGFDTLKPEYGQKVMEMNIPIVLVDSDRLDSGHFCCVEADASVVGSLIEELMEMTISSLRGMILVVGAGPSRRNRDLTREALHKAFKTRKISPSFLEMDFDNADENSIAEIEAALRNNDISSACALNSRSTKILCEALERSGKKGCFPVIGNGIFEESRSCLEQGVLTAIVDKKPYEQCRQALEVMTEYMTRETAPTSEKIQIQIQAVFRSIIAQI